MKQICENCGKEIEVELDQRDADLEAELEFEKLYPKEDREEAAVICDDCFKIMYPWMVEKGLIDPNVS